MTALTRARSIHPMRIAAVRRLRVLTAAMQEVIADHEPWDIDPDPEDEPTIAPDAGGPWSAPSVCPSPALGARAPG